MSDTGAEVLKSLLTPVIPDQVQGFAVRVGVGPYPPDKPRSRQKAVYAELTPVSAHAHAIVAAKGRKRVLGMVPLTEAGADALAAEPGGREAERAARIALTEAVRLVRTN
jgi:hypothetical protein